MCVVEGGCVRLGPLPADVRAALHELLPLPELPAADGKRVRHQPADRGRSRRAARRRAATGRRSSRRRKHARIFRCPTCQVAVFSQYGRPRCGSSAPARSTSPRASSPTRTSIRGRSCLDHAPGLGARVRGVLRLEDAVAGGQPRAVGGARGSGELGRLSSFSTSSSHSRWTWRSRFPRSWTRSR